MADGWTIAGVVADILIGILLLAVSWGATRANQRLTRLEEESHKRELLAMGIRAHFLDQDEPWYRIQAANPTNNPVVVTGIVLQIADGKHISIRNPEGVPMFLRADANGLGIRQVGNAWVKQAENVEVPPGHVVSIFIRLGSLQPRSRLVRLTAGLRGPGMKPITFTEYVVAHQAIRNRDLDLPNHFEEEAQLHTYREMPPAVRQSLRASGASIPDDSVLFPNRRKWWYFFFRM